MTKKVVVQDGFYGSASVTKTFPKSYEMLVVANTGSAALTFEVGGIKLELAPGYKFDERVETFNVVKITATDSFLCYVRDEV